MCNSSNGNITKTAGTQTQRGQNTIQKRHQRRLHQHKNTIPKIIREANIVVFVFRPRRPRCHPRGRRCSCSGRRGRPGGCGRCHGRRRRSLRQCIGSMGGVVVVGVAVVVVVVVVVVAAVVVLCNVLYSCTL